MRTFPRTEDVDQTAVVDLPVLLSDARELIAAGFCKSRPAAAADGKTVPSLSREAVSYDVFGALNRAAKKQGINGIPTAATFLIRRSMGRLGVQKTETIASYTDHPNTSQADVLAVIDDAIATLKTLY